jgi:hypothetical protein
MILALAERAAYSKLTQVRALALCQAGRASRVAA